MAVPSYFYSPAYWSQLNSGTPTVGLAVVNPSNGPGRSLDPYWAATIRESQQKGVQVLGYVSTVYGIQNPSTVKAQIDQYYSWYKVDGIFFDEGSVDCGLTPYYSSLGSYVKSKGGRAITVLNPGANIGECYATTMDILVNFEGTWQAYASWNPSTWVFRHGPERFWHIVHDCPPASLPDAIARSQRRGAGWVYVSPDNAENAYIRLPASGYWLQELQAIGTPSTTAPPLSRWFGWNDATQATYGFSYRPSQSGSWTSLRAYLDTDLNVATGMAVGGLGADAMLEQSSLHSWSGSWRKIRSITQSSSGGLSWKVSRSDIGKASFPAQARVVFQLVSSSGAVASSPVYTHELSGSTGSITEYWALNDATTVTYNANFPRSFTYHLVYIDLDRNRSTGFASVDGIGAEYVIEEDTLFRWVTATRAWTRVGAAGLSANGSKYSWTLPRATLGNSGAAPQSNSIVFVGTGRSPRYATPKYLHQLSP